MEKILPFFKKHLVPQFLYKRLQSPYHFLLAFLGALFYGFPSKKLVVIGVTGTKGKTTVCNLIAEILNKSGFRAGMATTVNFRIGNKEWINDTKQTMLGRFKLQKLLRRMVNEGCKYAVIETSSEGILQYRHRFIDYSIAVFTNLTPEHLERHGGFESYRNAKLKLFEQVVEKKNGVGVYNLDDPNVSYFLKVPIANQYVYTLRFRTSHGEIKNLNFASNIKSDIGGTTFLFNGEKFEMPLIGEFNVYNAAAAICVALSEKIPLPAIKKALAEAKAPPGRLEVVNKGQNFNIIIDYAHEPVSLEAVYSTLAKSRISASGGSASGGKNKKSKMICLLGAQGGGRDKWKRSAMGKIAEKYCSQIILTNEDPYDEDPFNILNDIAAGIKNKRITREIIDRREAIVKAISLAKKNDIVVLTGKDGEVWMCVENGKKIPWDERKIVEDALSNQSLISFANSRE